MTIDVLHIMNFRSKILCSFTLVLVLDAVFVVLLSV